MDVASFHPAITGSCPSKRVETGTNNCSSALCILSHSQLRCFVRQVQFLLKRIGKVYPQSLLLELLYHEKRLNHGDGATASRDYGVKAIKDHLQQSFPLLFHRINKLSTVITQLASPSTLENWLSAITKIFNCIVDDHSLRLDQPASGPLLGALLALQEISEASGSKISSESVIKMVTALQDDFSTLAIQRMTVGEVRRRVSVLFPYRFLDNISMYNINKI